MRSFGQLIDSVLNYIYPPRCPGCDEVIWIKSTDSFCPECRAKWEEHKNERCRRCGQPIRECWCGVPEDVKGYVDEEHHLVQYDKSDSVVKDLIYSIKNHYNKRAFVTLAKEMYDELYFRLDYNDLVVAAVPRSPLTKRRVGHDQSENLAKEFCAVTGLEFVDVLINIGNKKQKQLNQNERNENALKSYRIKNGITQLVKDKNIILIDDVVTTGSTVARCAHLLKWKGASKVIVFSIAKTV